MMSMEWVAGLLAPADIAPHPNFETGHRATAAGLFALLSLSRIGEFDRLVQDMEDLNPQGGLGLLEAVRRGQGVDGVKVAARELQSLAMERASDAPMDLATRTAAGVVACAMFAEHDEYGQIFALLNALLEDARGDSPDERLLRAILLLQKGLRLADVGESGGAEAAAALELLVSVRPADISAFRTSRGVQWSSRVTIRDIRAALIEAARGVIISLEGFSGQGWKQQVRAMSSRLPLQASRRAATGYAAYVDEIFKSSVGSTERVIRSSDPVETELYAVAVQAEYGGNVGAARRWRGELAKLRYQRGGHPDDVWLKSDSLRLLRQAQDVKATRLAVRDLRAAGPLAALSADLQRLLTWRVNHPQAMRDVELIVLEGGAELLDAAAAATAMDAVLRCLESGPPLRRGGWEAPSVRLELALLALAGLANVAGRANEAIGSLLKEADRADPQDELVDRGSSYLGWV